MKPPMRFRAAAIFPSGMLGEMKLFATHRQAQRFVVETTADNRLKRIYGIRLFVAGNRKENQ